MKPLVRFQVVGLAGAAVQLGLIHLLHQWLGLPYLAATLVAVEAAVLHNYWWHWRWTWAERQAPAGRFLRFQCTTGVASLAGNALGMKLLAGVAGLPVGVANLATILALYVLNYTIADRYVFRMR